MIKMFTGPMFSGKTEKLISFVKRDLRKVLVLKPAIDTRSVHVRSRTGAFLPALHVEDSDFVRKEKDFSRYPAIAVDEFQFLGDSFFYFVQKYKQQIDFYLAGLDRDYTGEFFPITKKLFRLKGEKYFFMAVCARCGEDAEYTHRKVNEQGVFLVGDAEAYEPLCYSCFLEERTNGKS